MLLKLFVFCLLLCDVLPQEDYYVDTGYSYELLDEDGNESLNVTITNVSYQQFQITIECYNYNSLKYLEIRLDEPNRFEVENGVLLHFIKCFNNATDNENYYYGLSRLFNNLPYYRTEQQDGYTILLSFSEYATVNSDVLFKNFEFRKFAAVIFYQIGFKSTKFLSKIYCPTCVFEYSDRIDFNDFSDTIAKTSWLQIRFNKILNFNRENLKKFSGLNKLEISDFDVDDLSAFNIPGLFERNVNVTEIRIENSKEKITLHEQVLRGLKNLEEIWLQNLKLDNIPKYLFKDLEKLDTVYLSSNNIKSIDPATFETNKNMIFISFYGNPIFTELHDKLEPFVVGSDLVSFEFGDFTLNTFDLLEQLVNDPKVDHLRFQSFLIDKFNATRFTKIQKPRNSPINIHFEGGSPVLDLEHNKSIGHFCSEYDIREILLNTVIHIQLSGDAICRDCDMIKSLFPQFLIGYQNTTGFYLEESKIFIQFQIPDSCNHLEEYFDEIFVEDCPTNCGCKYSPLIDKVKIDCSNTTLTEIPRIPYSELYDQVQSMDLNFENNSITILSLENQDADVLKKLSSLNFKNNNIISIQIDEAVFSSSIRALNLCGNPIVAIDEIELTLASGHQYFNDFNCFLYEYPVVGEYIVQHKSRKLIDKYLNALKCN